MKKTVLSTVLALFCILTSCADPLPEVQGSPDLAAKELVSEASYYSRIPSSETSVFAMRVMKFSDGSVEVSRAAIPFSNTLEYTHYVLDGAANVEESNAGVSATFQGNYWFVPFDPSAQPAAMGGGGMTITCDCMGTGACDLSGTIKSSGVIHWTCTSRDCDKECGGSITHGVAPHSHYGLAIAANHLSAY